MFSKRISRVVFSLILAVCLLCIPMVCHAEIYHSKDNLGDHETIFVAGNPDLYPIESYNRITGEYEGILPELYQMISEETGIDFTYIYSGNKNKQAYLAENRQVDIVSAYTKGEDMGDYVPETQMLLTFYVKDKKYEAVIGFTSVCPEEEMLAIVNFLENLPEEELTSVAVTYVMAHERIPKVHPLLVVAGILVLIGLIVFGIVMMKKYRKLRALAGYHEVYDAKTGLYNEKYLSSVLDTKILAQAKEMYYAAKIMPDRERLERYYDEAHIEALEKYIAETLKTECGKHEYAARTDDLTFIVVFRNANEEDAKARMDALMTKINAENGILGEDYKVAVRGGVYHCTRFNEDSERVFSITEEAYNHAEQTSSDYIFATAEMIRAADRRRLLQRETAQAVKNGEILYYLQYIVDVRSSEVCGAEAISRWQHPREGLLMPGVYISLMQQAKTIGMLDYYIFEKTCKQLEEWKGTEKDPFFISCNFDRLTIAEEHFFDKLMEISSRYDVPRGKIYLEITEDTLEYNKEVAFRNAVRCKEAGFRLALDDFGSGCTSFNTLLDFPITLLKMDRSFIRMIDTERGYSLISGIVKAAQSVGYEIIFEGVETEEQRELVEKAGVEYIQGYLFSRVVPYIEATRTLASINMRLKKIEEEFSDPEVAAIFDGSIKVFHRVGYSKSFEVKLAKANDFVHATYREIKDVLMSYTGAVSKISMVYDAIYIGKKPIVKLLVTSKAVLVCLALDPANYQNTNHIYKDVSYSRKYRKVPMCVKVIDEDTKNALIALLHELLA
ncbi:MAG: EAL domain-containing protein [Clostridia bacterium]|nr:EAL domain-containing protein [Clostridia bacterium]